MIIEHAIEQCAKWVNELTELKKVLNNEQFLRSNLNLTCGELVKHNEELKIEVHRLKSKYDYPEKLNSDQGLCDDVNSAVLDVDKYLVDIAREYRLVYSDVVAMFKKQAEAELIE